MLIDTRNSQDVTCRSRAPASSRRKYVSALTASPLGRHQRDFPCDSRYIGHAPLFLCCFYRIDGFVNISPSLFELPNFCIRLRQAGLISDEFQIYSETIESMVRALTQLGVASEFLNGRQCAALPCLRVIQRPLRLSSEEHAPSLRILIGTPRDLE
jgi:hypothetical protein